MSVTLTNAGNSNVTVSKVTVSGARYSASGVSAGLILYARTIRDIGRDILSRGRRQLIRRRDGCEQCHKFTGSHLTFRARQHPDQAVSHSVSLNWTAEHIGRGGLRCLSLRSFRRAVHKIGLQPVAADSYVDSTVQAGQTYYYVVTSVTSAGVRERGFNPGLRHDPDSLSHPIRVGSVASLGPVICSSASFVDLLSTSCNFPDHGSEMKLQ